MAGERLRGEEQISPDSTHENSFAGLAIIKLIKASPSHIVMRKLKPIPPELTSDMEIANVTTHHLDEAMAVAHRRECRVCTDDGEERENPMGSYC